jgi:hypothetical protein
MSERSCESKRKCDKKETASATNRGDYSCRAATWKTDVPFIIASLIKKRNAFHREICYV